MYSGTASAAHRVRRCWSELPTDLCGSILRRLRRHDDHVRFSVVCRQWRSCARQYAFPSQFPWLALPDQTFYSLPDSAFQPLLPHLDFHRQQPHAQSSCGEWLVFERIDGAYTMVNPFSMATTMVLPRLSTGPPHVSLGTPEPCFRKLVVCSPNLVAAVVGEGWRHKLALCRPGAASWVVIAHDMLRSVQDMIFYQGKLYVLHKTSGRLLSVSVGDDRDTGEPTVTRVDSHMEGPASDSAESPLQYLLESDGTLLMIRREDPNIQDWNHCLGDSGDIHWVGAGLEKAAKFKVFEADLVGSRWTEVSSAGEDRVLFVGQWCSRAVRVPDQCKEYIMGDRIFFVVDDHASRGYAGPCHGKKVGFYCSVYDMRKQRSQTYLGTKVRPLKGFPVAWLFHRQEEQGMSS